MKPFRYQLLGHLLAGLLIALLLNVTVEPDAGEAAVPLPQPFTTQEMMLVVTVAFFPDAPPRITAVQPLERGRLTVLQPGPFSLGMEDISGKQLYRVSFPVVFTMPGIDKELDENRLVLVVPDLRQAVRLVVEGPTGRVEQFLGRE